MRILAIIPARGGSKGIPRKNLRMVGGKPLVGRTVELARWTPSVNRVVVSTDDREIEETARNYGAETIRRPAELSGDAASSESALLHVLAQLEKGEDYRPDLVVFLQCTSPLTSPEDVEGTIQTLLKAGADCAFTAAPFHYFIWRQTHTGEAVGVNHESTRRPTRQEREPHFLETGAVYVMRAPGFQRARHRFFGKVVMHTMPTERCLEIDEPADLERAEIALKWLEGRKNGGAGAGGQK
jgi:CMP-N-acetylneuraminic acid synthetase